MVYFRSDAQLQRDVLHELAREAGETAADIAVHVDDGVVTLLGTVPSVAVKLLAQDAAHRVRGILDVANDLAVVPSLDGGVATRLGTRTDTEIARALRQALEWDPLVPHERIHTAVSDGWVVLEGEVERPCQRADAEQDVRSVAGVRGVVNKITVGAKQAGSRNLPR